MMKVQSLKGTRDFYPDDKAKLDYIIGVWRSVAEKFGYEEFDGPLLEPTRLWQLKSGSEIPEQMYVFEDKSGREVAVRPEMTPTLARMVAQKQKVLVKPIKWYSVSRCWRYEAPQSGRLREFFQFNLDCLGTDSMMADAEVIATAIKVMQQFGCNDSHFYIRLNNRALILDILLNLVGVKKSQLKDVSRLIDKKDKISFKDFNKGLDDIGLGDEQIKKVHDFMAYTGLEDIPLEILSDDGKKAFSEFKELLEILDSFGLMKYIEIDFSIMRGFDYYTSTVFEVFDRNKKFRAIAGGGRYDDLVEDFGGERSPGVGYGMGDVVLGLFLENLKLMPKLSKDVDYYIAVLDKGLRGLAFKIADKLRKKYIVEMDIMGRSLGKQFSYANKINAKKVIIVGPKEAEHKKVKVKDLVIGKEKVVDIKEIK